MHAYLLEALGATLGATVFLVASPIYQCHMDGEPPIFSDRPCRGAVAVEIDVREGVHFAPLSELEQTKLQELAEASHARRVEQQRLRRQARLREQLAAELADRACQEAREGLRELRLQRRQGYSLAEAARLEDRAAELRDSAREHC